MYEIKSIAVLITCHNRKKKTLACLQALLSCELPNTHTFEVYLVDDQSTDGTLEMIKNIFPQVNIIHGNGNLFWNRGMHLAWENASINNFDYYLWLNDDTFLYQNAIVEVLECSTVSNNQSIICGTTCSEYDNTKITYGGQKSKVGVLMPDGSLQSCDFFNGNIVLVPKYVFRRVGNLDAIFHHSVGDIDYGIRAIKKGISIYTTRICIGTCELHEKIAKWRSPNEPLINRLKALYSPLGCNPFEFFVFDCRQNNILIAIKHFFTIHIKVIFTKMIRN